MSNPDNPIVHKHRHGHAHEVAKAGDHVDEAHKPHKAALGTEAAKILSSPGGNDAAVTHQAKAKHADTPFIKHDVVIVSDNGSKPAKLVARGDAAHSLPVVKVDATKSDVFTGKADAQPKADAPVLKADAQPKADAPTATRGDAVRPDAAAQVSNDSKPLKIVDKTAPHAENFQPESAPAKPGVPPQITVTLEDKGKPADKEPHFYIKKDGTVEMHGDPEALKSKDVRITLERDQGEINPTGAQKQAADQLVNYVNDKLKENYPQEANKVVLNDQGDIVSQKRRKRPVLNRQLI